MDSWLSFEHDIAPAHANHLGNARTCIVQGAEHGAVPLARPSSSVWRLDNGADLVSRQKANHGPVKSLLWDCERPFDGGQSTDIVMSSVF